MSLGGVVAVALVRLLFFAALALLAAEALG